MQKRYALASYACGAAVARIGDEMSGPALLLAGLAATGSAATASLPPAGITVSAAVGGPLFGVLLDRSARPGRLLAGALGGYAAGLLAVLGCLGRVSVALAVLVAVGAGLLGPALSGGWTSQLPRVVATEALPGAQALDAMTFGLAGLAGPALAGVVAEFAGAPAGVTVAAALICLALPPSLTLPAASEPTRERTRRPACAPTAPVDRGTLPPATEPTPEQDPAQAQIPNPPQRPTHAPTAPGDPGTRPPTRKPTQAQTPNPPQRPTHAPTAPGDPGTRPPAAEPAREGMSVRGVVGEMAGGFRAVGRSRALARATATSVVSCAGQGMLLTCLPLLGEQALGGAGHGALLLSCTAASGLAANAVLARHPHRMRPDTVVGAGALVLAAALLLAATGRPVLLVAAALLAGLGEGPPLTALFAIRHREAPPDVRARVFTTGASLKITALGLGAGVAGPIAARSLSGALLVAAGVQVLAGPAGGWAGGRVRHSQSSGSEGDGSSSRRA